jgi:hypothetical protein
MIIDFTLVSRNMQENIFMFSALKSSHAEMVRHTFVDLFSGRIIFKTNSVRISFINAALRHLLGFLMDRND